MTATYRGAGVDLEVADEITARLKASIGTGLFGGFIPVSELKTYHEPVLVSSIDGIGTKVKLAAELGQLGGLGRDIVHHCVNDIAAHGAQALFFMDYLAFHRLDESMVDQIVASIASACDELGIRLAGGETAEMPLVYTAGSFDIAGSIVGAVEQDEIIDGNAIREGDILIGLASSGAHTNGYSLIQSIFTREDYDRDDAGLGMPLGQALLEPHRCYVKAIENLISTGTVHGFAHITGGGIEGNLGRIIPDGLEAQVDLPAAPPLFTFIQSRGVPWEEMRRVFNMGIGLIAVCDRSVAGQLSPPGQRIGDVQKTTETKRKVRFT